MFFLRPTKYFGNTYQLHAQNRGLKIECTLKIGLKKCLVGRVSNREGAIAENTPGTQVQTLCAKHFLTCSLRRGRGVKT